MKFIIPVALCLLTFGACKKPTIQSVNTNNSKDSLTYQPKVAGSRWTYTRTVATVNNTNYNFLRLTTDSVFYGNTYNMYNSDIDGLQYLRQDGDKYYTILTASTNKPPILVIDAAKNVGESWIGGVNGDDTYTFTMQQKLPTYSLDGFTFKNVLVINQKRTKPDGTITLNGNTFYAQGVGQVKSEGTVSGVSVTIKLISVDLK